MRRYLALALILSFALPACSTQDGARQAVRNATYPDLLPMRDLDVEGTPPTTGEPTTGQRTADALTARAENLRNRAAALAEAPLE